MMLEIEFIVRPVPNREHLDLANALVRRCREQFPSVAVTYTEGSPSQFGHAEDWAIGRIRGRGGREAVHAVRAIVSEEIDAWLRGLRYSTKELNDILGREYAMDVTYEFDQVEDSDGVMVTMACYTDPETGERFTFQARPTDDYAAEQKLRFHLWQRFGDRVICETEREG